MSQQFEWDAAKAATNVAEHGVTFEEALTVFADPLARIFADPDHSAGEMREIIIGQSTQARLIVVAFTERDDRIRIISARETTARERRDYEESTPKAEGR
ncbi:MAG TPA: BrnT family toxin [Vicinamibacterales bacterium]|jgi:uncharacterized DUF497 family protein|nr:BrnT family toxin [Vicinamibacterales bacterium]